MRPNKSFLAIILTLWCCHLPLTGAQASEKINPRILEIFHLHKSADTFQRTTRQDVDLREHRLFSSNPKLDCCPTITELTQRAVGINPQGLLLELFHTPNFTQTFYETACHPAIKGRPCQFIDRKYMPYSKCVQQYSYVYALGRAYGNWYEPFRIDYVRVATGCKCQLAEDLVSDYSIRSRYLNEI